MKNLFFVPLILLISKIIAQTDATIPCSYADSASCLLDKTCQWDKTQTCTNKKDCSQIKLERCDISGVCFSTPSTHGVCTGPQAHCQPNDFKQCCNDPLCSWTKLYNCVPKDPCPVIPNCSAMNPIQCKKNDDFCNLSGQCFDNKQYCQGLGSGECLNDPSCFYTFTQKEQCLNNPKFCEGLNEKQCFKNNLYCHSANTVSQCINQFNCDGLRYDECKQNSQYCSAVQKFTCSPRKNICSFLTNPDKCKLAGCIGSYENEQFICSSPLPCSQYDEEKCKANQNFCIYTPGPFVCKNNVECNNIGDAKLCASNKYCEYIPSQFQCLPIRQKCHQLRGRECKNNPSCTYIPAQGFCDQERSFGCEKLNSIKCYEDAHCISKYDCSTKEIPSCNRLGKDECEQQSLFCDLEERGECNDNEYNCDLNEERCLFTKPCAWNAGVQGQCQNIIQCGSLLKDQCKLNNAYCNFNKDGYCRPI